MNIPAPLLDILRSLFASGRQAFVVGGAVRESTY